jgi:hypothetical protein
MLKTIHPYRRQRHLYSMDSGPRRNDTENVAGVKAVHFEHSHRRRESPLICTLDNGGSRFRENDSVCEGSMKHKT